MPTLSLPANFTPAAAENTEPAAVPAPQEGAGAAEPEQGQDQQEEDAEEEPIDWEGAEQIEVGGGDGGEAAAPAIPAAAPPQPALQVAPNEMSVEELEGCDFLPASTESALNSYKLGPDHEQRLREYERKWPGVLSRHGCPLCNHTFSSTSEFMVRYTALLKEPLVSCPPTVRYREIETLYRTLVVERMNLAGSMEAHELPVWSYEIVVNHFTHHTINPAFLAHEVTEKLTQIWRVLYSRSLARIQVSHPGSDPRCTEQDSRMIKLWIDLSSKLESSLKAMATAGDASVKRGSAVGAESAGVKVA